MIELQDSIKEYGVLNPLTVRPRKEGYYEIISGHRRKSACKKANETGSIYHEDIEELRTNQKEILQEMRKVLDRLTTIM